jgi:1-acyl-sn-glycerol-3-phosphate acyltransferase
MAVQFYPSSALTPYPRLTIICLHELTTHSQQPVSSLLLRGNSSTFSAHSVVTPPTASIASKTASDLSNLMRPLKLIPPTITYLADEEGNYRSLPWKPGFLARLFPSIFFYTAFIHAVIKYGLRAKRGDYDDTGWYHSSLTVMRALEETGANIQITGLDVFAQIPGPCVIVANHMSTLETIILPGILQPVKDLTFVVKRSIVEIPIFKHMMLSRDPIVVDRVNPREDLVRVLSEGAAQLAKGRSIIVFPQTTRTTTFDPAHFNTIGIKLARQAGVPIVPVAVRSDAWGIGKLIKEFGKVDVSLPVQFAFGDPIMVEGRGNSTHQAIIRFISTHLESWGCNVIEPPASTVTLATSTAE